VPLTYLVRERQVPTAEDLAQDLDDIDEDLVATCNHGTLGFRAGNTLLYDMIKSLIIDGCYWSYVQAIDSRRDGRLAYLKLKEQAEGPVALSRRKLNAYALLKTQFSGNTLRFTFENYVNTYQEAFNELTYLGETISESKKVDDFLTHITDSKYHQIKAMIRGDPMISSNFETCQQRCKQIYESLDIGHPADRNRTVAAVSTRGQQPPHRGPATVARNQRMNSGILHYSREEYARLTPEQKEKLRNDRSAAKAAKAARRPATAITVGAVTSTSAKPTFTLGDRIPRKAPPKVSELNVDMTDARGTDNQSKPAATPRPSSTSKPTPYANYVSRHSKPKRKDKWFPSDPSDSSDAEDDEDVMDVCTVVTQETSHKR
jgi:hypothetical protein